MSQPPIKSDDSKKRGLFNSEAFQSLAVRDFRLYWVGNTLSQFGTQMQTVALAWQIYLLTHQPLSLGLIGLVQAGPALLFSIFGGVLADSMSRRRLLLITQTVLLIMSAALAFITFSGIHEVFLFYLLIFLSAVAVSADGPTQSAVVPSLVPRQLMANAITLNNLAGSMAGVMGPALGGIVIGWLGAGAVFAFDAVSFLAMLAALLLIRTPLYTPANVPAENRTVAGSINRIVEGFRFLRHNLIILNFMLLDFFAVLFGAALTLLPIFAEDILKVGPAGLGVLAAAPAIGSLLGAVGLTIFHRPRKPGLVVMLAIAVYGLAAAIFGLSQIFWLSWLMLAITGVADTVSMTLRQSVRQLLTPEELRGRIAGVHILFASSGTQLGEFESGVVAQIIGAQSAVALGGFLCLAMVAGVAIFYPKIHRFREDLYLSSVG